VVKVIQMEEYQYQDPATRFFKELYVELDFEMAQKELGQVVRGEGCWRRSLLEGAYGGLFG
jgi:hypothetical protein